MFGLKYASDDNLWQSASFLMLTFLEQAVCSPSKLVYAWIMGAKVLCLYKSGGSGSPGSLFVAGRANSTQWQQCDVLIPSYQTQVSPLIVDLPSFASPQLHD